MLAYYSPTRRYKKPIAATPTSNLFPLKTLFSEAARRDAIIKNLVSKIDFGEGDTCEPYTEEAREDYGLVVVEKICRNYTQLGRKEQWPNNDCPMLITCYSEKKDYRFICTTDFIRKVKKP